MISPSEAPNGWAGSIVALVEAILLAMIGSGMLTMDNEQAQLWINVAVAAVAVLTPIFGFVWASGKQTPLVKPRDEDDEPLVRADGAIPKAQMRHEFGGKPKK
jgi:hypothetical protein